MGGDGATGNQSPRVVKTLTIAASGTTSDLCTLDDGVKLSALRVRGTWSTANITLKVSATATDEASDLALLVDDAGGSYPNADPGGAYQMELSADKVKSVRTLQVVSSATQTSGCTIDVIGQRL